MSGIQRAVGQKFQDVRVFGFLRFRVDYAKVRSIGDNLYFDVFFAVACKLNHRYIKSKHEKIGLNSPSLEKNLLTE